MAKVLRQEALRKQGLTPREIANLRATIGKEPPVPTTGGLTSAYTPIQGEEGLVEGLVKQNFGERGIPIPSINPTKLVLGGTPDINFMSPKMVEGVAIGGAVIGGLAGGYALGAGALAISTQTKAVGAWAGGIISGTYVVGKTTSWLTNSASESRALYAESRKNMENIVAQLADPNVQITPQEAVASYNIELQNIREMERTLTSLMNNDFVAWLSGGKETLIQIRSFLGIGEAERGTLTPLEILNRQLEGVIGSPVIA